MRWGYSFNEDRIANIRWAWDQRLQREQQGHSPHSAHSPHGLSPPPVMSSFNGYLSSSGRLSSSFGLNGTVDAFGDAPLPTNGHTNGNSHRSGSSSSSSSSHGSPPGATNTLNMPSGTHAHLSSILHPEPSSSSSSHHYPNTNTTHAHTLPLPHSHSHSHPHVPSLPHTQSLPSLSHTTSGLSSSDASLFFDMTRPFAANPPTPTSILSSHHAVSAGPFYMAATRATVAPFYHPPNGETTTTNTGIESSLGESSVASQQRTSITPGTGSNHPSTAEYWNFASYD